jgi:hypothetical protein
MMYLQHLLDEFGFVPPRGVAALPAFAGRASAPWHS